MRNLPWLLLILLALPGAARAQQCGVVNGVDYRFERQTAFRTVDDSDDRGRIALAVYVYRPVAAPSRGVVLFSHGSLDGMLSDPREPAAVNCALKDYFLRRGYTLVFPMRRGRGDSGGHYIEECGRRFDSSCTPARNREIAARALDEALADDLAVLDQLIVGRLAPAGTPIVAAGLSRGGFLSLALAAARPAQIAAVVNWSGGWLGLQQGMADADERALRIAFHAQRLGAFGAAYRGPTLWLYAPEDPFNFEEVTRGYHAAYTAAGGRADYVLVHPAGPNQHLILNEPALWQAEVDRLLTSVEGGLGGGAVTGMNPVTSVGLGCSRPAGRPARLSSRCATIAAQSLHCARALGSSPPASPPAARRNG